MTSNRQPVKGIRLQAAGSSQLTAAHKTAGIRWQESDSRQGIRQQASGITQQASDSR